MASVRMASSIAVVTFTTAFVILSVASLPGAARKLSLALELAPVGDFDESAMLAAAPRLKVSLRRRGKSTLAWS